jgi:hypothetical protein
MDSNAAMLKALSMIEALTREVGQLRQVINKQTMEIHDLNEALALYQ